MDANSEYAHVIDRGPLSIRRTHVPVPKPVSLREYRRSSVQRSGDGCVRKHSPDGPSPAWNALQFLTIRFRPTFAPPRKPISLIRLSGPYSSEAQVDYGIGATKDIGIARDNRGLERIYAERTRRR